MFNLDQAITEWRRQMVAGGIKSPEALEELESHLRDEVEQQMRLGASGQQAFEVAVQRIGQANALKEEFQKVGVSKTVLPRGVKTVLAVIFAGSILALNLSIKDELQALFLIDGLLLSLVLPLMAAMQPARGTGSLKRGMRTVWAGQICIGLGGLVVLLLPLHPVFGLVFSLISCIGFAHVLRGQLRVVVHTDTRPMTS
ncbi:permease prefix domain 1-containing protein [Pedosphaera parvula]|uniref:Uncharacterized protein n=1 Tax=Pedosphaera parvula (strain Ellin514) TaxID=320771 RepID=B9XCL1_PEDPL|nr:permease prefix domain 1-containing protein [Pedosphaera parvula]EEF62679.1 hypothetical protein Cflav_PD5314 [Pedosphaera parvula Ellin514]